MAWRWRGWRRTSSRERSATSAGRAAVAAVGWTPSPRRSCAASRRSPRRRGTVGTWGTPPAIEDASCAPCRGPARTGRELRKNTNSRSTPRRSGRSPPGPARRADERARGQRLGTSSPASVATLQIDQHDRVVVANQHVAGREDRRKRPRDAVSTARTTASTLHTAHARTHTRRLQSVVGAQIPRGIAARSAT